MTLDPAFKNELRKAASAMTADDRDVERAFADQGYTAIINKAGPLMDDTHRLGFEIVQKNDDNTRLMGIWAFRLGTASKDQMAYAPLCFVNGKVQGSDLLYRVGPKKFVCNTPDWARFLIEQSFQTSGKPIDRSEAGKTGPMFYGDRMLRTPAAFSKMSSERLGQWTELVNDMCRKVATEGVLGHFMRNHGGLREINALERWIDSSPKFARAMALKIPARDWLDEAIITSSIQRKAASKADPVTLMLFTGQPTPEILNRAKDRAKVASDLYGKGFCFEEQFQDVPDSKTIVYGEPGLNLCSPLEPGVYDVMLSGGETVRAAVGYSKDGYDIGDRGGNGGNGDCCYPVGYSSLRNLTVIPLDGEGEKGSMYRGTEEVWALQGTDATLNTAGDPILDAPSKVGFFIDPGTGRIYGPVEIQDTEKVGEVTHVNFTTFPTDSPDNHQRTLVVNPDLEDNDIAHGYANTSLRFVAVSPLPEEKSEGNCCPSSSWRFKRLIPGDGGDVHKLMINDIALEDRYKKASIRMTEDFDHTPLYTLTVGRRTTLPGTKLAMMIKLAGELAIAPDAAEEMLNSVTADTTKSWTIELPAKYASSMLQLMDAPRFEQHMDTVQNVPMEVPQAQVLRSVRNPIYRPASRIGDKYDPAKGIENSPDDDGDGDHVPARIIMSGSPEEIAQYAETNSLPHVFDHGILGSMARTYDMTHALDQYLPKMEDGLDALGRALLLFYWKPEDWKDLYGSDDRSELEGQLLSSFKGFGDLLLDLLKRSSHNARHPASA
jgi:hypothetical protein